jgi:hypothetical protein
VSILDLDASRQAAKASVTDLVPPATNPRRAFAVPVLGILTGFLILGSFAFRLDLLKNREFDPDEFEHLHSAWSLSKGQIPFRDYFEHHTPGLYFLLAPTFSFFDVDHSPEDAVAFVFFARRVMWCFAGAILALTFYLGVLCWKDIRVACIGTALIATDIVFLGKTLEIRPDVLSTAFWLGSLTLSARAMSVGESNKKVRWLFFASGLCLGLALVCSQKLLMAGPGMVVGVAWYCLDRRMPGTLGWRIRNIIRQALGTLAPVLVVLGYFAWHGSLYAFIQCNFLLNLGWQQETSVGATLHWLVVRDPFFIALAVPGGLLGFLSLFRAQRFSAVGVLIFANTLGLFLGLYLIPVPYPQYCLLFLPMVALYAAAFIVKMAEFFQSLLRKTSNPIKEFPAEALFFIGAYCLMLGCCVYIAEPKAIGLWFFPLIGALTILLATLFLKARLTSLALATFLIPGSVYSLQQMIWMRGLSNEEMVSNLRYVMERTSPDDVVMDGWSGLGVFRPHAWYYAFTHGGVRSTLDKEKLSQLENDFEKGAIAPKLIILDQHMAEISPKLTSLIETKYRPTVYGKVWERKR